MTLVEAAFRADPDYLPAQLALFRQFSDRKTPTQRRRYVAHTPGVPPADSACLRLAAAAAPGAARRQLAALDAVEKRYGRTACSTFLRAQWDSQLLPAEQPADLYTVEWPRVVALAPDDGAIWVAYVAALASNGDSTDAVRVARQALARDIDPRSRITLYAQVAGVRAADGDSAGARTARRALDDWIARHPSPEAHYESLLARWNAAPVSGDRADFDRAAAIAAAHHAWYDLGNQWLWLAARLLDGGDPAGAVVGARRALAFADSLDWAELRTRSLITLGRAYLKSGRWIDALRTLRLARSACDPVDLYQSAEVHHNLAHVYEGMGRMAEAEAEIDRFVSIADSMPNDPVHMISLYDAGVIRWEAGLHAAARVAFDSMVAVIDTRHKNYFYAGDYYERIGDLMRALHYYRAVPRDNTEEGARALSGLARVYDALGMPDSAEAAARAHDRDVQTPEEVPLLPGVLARHGHIAEALAIARVWADTQMAHANVNGAVAADLQLAGLLLDAGAPRLALQEVARADSGAARATLIGERGRAMTIQAAAELRLAHTAAAVREARIAVRETRDQGTDTDRRDALVVLGNALARSGRARQALRAYDGAGHIVEAMGRDVTADLPRARFQARQLEPFDEAVRLLLRMQPSPWRTAALLEWSQRRNDAAFPGRVAPHLPLDLAHIRSRLGPQRVLVDYVVLDSAAAAIVVTPRHAVVVPLAASAATLTALVDAVRRPFTTVYMGRIDLARAVPDAPAASALARLVLDPLAAYLVGFRRVTIVPDGPLHLLPFDLLPVDDSTIVADRFAVSLLPAVRLLSAPVRAPIAGADASLLIVGSDAPGAAREVRDVRRAWTDGPVRVLSAGDATERAIRRALPRYAVLHFATHAVVDATDPLASHLVLAADSVSDGLLEVREIERTPSRARLVVLSACESEDGTVFAGTGPIGLARAFLVGGARAVVATQWPVTATAADLMRAFYRYLALGDPPDEALRTAKEIMRHDPRTSNPIDWAGFVLVGSPDFRFGP